MLAAYVWHWWIGVILAVVAGLAVVGLIAGYLQKVTAPQHPNRQQRKAMQSAQPPAGTDQPSSA